MLHVLLGFKSANRTWESPVVLFCGHSASDLETAIALAPEDLEIERAEIPVTRRARRPVLTENELEILKTIATPLQHDEKITFLTQELEATTAEILRLQHLLATTGQPEILNMSPLPPAAQEEAEIEPLAESIPQALPVVSEPPGPAEQEAFGDGPSLLPQDFESEDTAPAKKKR